MSLSSTKVRMLRAMREMRLRGELNRTIIAMDYGDGRGPVVGRLEVPVRPEWLMPGDTLYVVKDWSHPDYGAEPKEGDIVLTWGDD